VGKAESRNATNQIQISDFRFQLSALSYLISTFNFPLSTLNQGRLSIEFRDRTKRFAAASIRLFVQMPKGCEEVRVLGKQLLRSGTSVAAHVREASRARSDEEFVSKLGGALQEADESGLWLELLREECGIDAGRTGPLEAEASELIAIITTMIKKTKGKS
jgi:four helix bundle protein